jgi:hypothetical protein
MNNDHRPSHSPPIPTDEELYFEARHRVLEGTWDAESKLEKIAFTLGEPDVGWIDATLRLESDTFPISLSDVYPPFQEMLAWLERLIPDRSPGVLRIHDEYSDHFFRMTRIGEGDVCLFEYVLPVYPPGGLYRRAHISFNAAVKEFHAALEYLMSIDFEAEEEKEEGSRVWFKLNPKSDEIIRLDLSTIRTFLAGQDA